MFLTHVVQYFYLKDTSHGKGLSRTIKLTPSFKNLFIATTSHLESGGDFIENEYILLTLIQDSLSQKIWRKYVEIYTFTNLPQ